MKTILVCLLALSSLAHAAAAQADENWQWIKVSNNAAYGWQPETGTAVVKIKGQSFEALLFWPDHPDRVRIKLSGSIKKNQIKVTETVLQTDLGEAQYTGRYKKEIWNEPFEESKGTEAITLSDGYSMIGLRRNIAK